MAVPKKEKNWLKNQIAGKKQYLPDRKKRIKNPQNIKR